MVSWFHPPFVHLIFQSKIHHVHFRVHPWVPSKEYKESKELGISNQEVSPSPPPAASSVPLGWFEPQPMLGEENLLDFEETRLFIGKMYENVEHEPYLSISGQFMVTSAEATSTGGFARQILPKLGI